LRDIQGVREVDPRLVLETSVLEIPGIIPNPTDPNEAVVIGDSRYDEALILGVEPEGIVNKWLIMGSGLDKADQKSTIIGDSLALKMFDSPQNQSIKVLDKNFGIVGVCLDPLNNGKVVYMPLTALSDALGQNGYNLIFLKIDYSHSSSVLAEIKNEISGENLTLVELNETLGRHVDFLNNIWSLVMFLPIFSLTTAILCLLSYLMLFITGQQREFGIMRALGAKPRSIMKIVFMQALLITLISAAIGISVGLFVTFVFLIPEPVISQYALVSVAGWLLSALGLLCFSSLYPAAKAARKSVVNALYSF
jgi:ABC-type antimicrobial peptide transport system permease subunit